MSIFTFCRSVLYVIVVLKYDMDSICLKKGLLVLIKDTTKNKVNWKVGCIINLIVGKDGVIRGYKIVIGSGYVIERF